MNKTNNHIINYGSKIWDLHIHTCKCPKGSSEFSKMSVEDYVAKIIEVFNNYPELELISFTDHNYISIEVYEEYIRCGAPKAFVVGVEIDTVLNENDEESCIKHLIVYFDIDKTNFADKKDSIQEFNAYLQNKSSVKIDDLLNYLVSKHHKFILSPHAFKQGKRGIDHNWTDEVIANEQASKYLDQFFSFWETSGTSAIARAKEFLKDKLGNDSVQLVHFSDSNNFEKLVNYLEAPTQYFRALPLYKGVELVGTDASRISQRYECLDSSNSGNLIKSIIINGEEIRLSEKLNAIIGGRGTGKSLLLDVLANNLNDNKTQTLGKSRKEFMSQFDVTVRNFTGQIIEPNSFKFDYYSQAYVAEMFRSKNYNSIIQERFSEELDQISDFSADDLKAEDKKRFREIYNGYIKEFDSKNEDSQENISSLAEKYQVLNEHSHMVNFSKIKKDKTEAIDYKKFKQNFNKYINKVIPDQLKNETSINELSDQFELGLLYKIHQYNLDWNDTSHLKNLILDGYKEYKNNLNDRTKVKAKIEKEFTDQFSSLMYPYVKRVALINTYIKMNELIKETDERSYESMGEDGSFKFAKVLHIEKPFEHLKNIFEKYFYAEHRNTLEAAIKYYCFTNTHRLMANKNRYVQDIY